MEKYQRLIDAIKESDNDGGFSELVSEVVSTNRDMRKIIDAQKQKASEDEARREKLDKEVKEWMENFGKLKEEVTKLSEWINSNAPKKVKMGLPSEITKDEGKEIFGKWFAARLRKDKDTLDSINKALDTGTGGSGTEFVPTPLIPTVARLIEDASIIRPRATVIPMTSDVAKFPSIASVAVAYPGEGVAGSEATVTTSAVTLNASTQRAFVLLSNELMADATPSLAEVLAELFAEASGQEEDKQALAGSGSPFTGVLNAASVNQLNAGGGTASGSTTFSDLTADDLGDMVSGIKSSASAGAVFIMHRTVFNIVRKLKAGASDSTYIYSPPGGNQPGTVWGFPYLLSDQMPDLASTAVSTNFVVFGNPKYIYIGDRGQPGISLSEDAKFIENQTVLRFTNRHAVTVAVPTALARLRTSAT